MSKLRFPRLEDQFQESIFRKVYTLLVIFGYRPENSPPFVELFLAGLSKLHSTCPSEQFEKTVISGKNSYFQISFRSWANNFRLLGKNNWRFCRNCVLSVCRTSLVKDITFWRNHFLNILFGQWTKRFWFLWKNLARRCQSAFYLSIAAFSQKKSLLRKKFCFRKSLFFQKIHFLNKNVRSFVETIPVELWKQHFRCL